MELKDQLSEAVKASVREALETMLSVTLEDTDESPDLSSADGLIGSVGITGALDGNMAIILSGENACAFASKTLQKDIKEVNEEVTDEIGKIANTIAGVVKTKMSEAGSDFEIGSPSVTQGKEASPLEGDDITKVSLGFKCDLFHLGVVVQCRASQKDQTAPEGDAVEEKAAEPQEGQESASAEGELLKKIETPEGEPKSEEESGEATPESQEGQEEAPQEQEASSQEETPPAQEAQPQEQGAEQEEAPSLGELLEKNESDEAGAESQDEKPDEQPPTDAPSQKEQVQAAEPQAQGSDEEGGLESLMTPAMIKLDQLLKEYKKKA